MIRVRECGGGRGGEGCRDLSMGSLLFSLSLIGLPCTCASCKERYFSEEVFDLCEGEMDFHVHSFYNGSL